MSKNDLIVSKERWDIWELYKVSYRGTLSIPNFHLLLEEYQMNSYLEETNMTAEATRKSLITLRSGTFDLSFIEKPKMNMFTEFELFDQVMMQHYFIEKDKRLYNKPIKEVW